MPSVMPPSKQSECRHAEPCFPRMTEPVQWCKDAGLNVLSEIGLGLAVPYRLHSHIDTGTLLPPGSRNLTAGVSSIVAF